MMKPSKKRILHFLDSDGMYGAESVVINLSREMMDAGRYEPVIGCIVKSEEDDVELYNVALRYGIESHKFKINNSQLYKDLPRFSSRLKALGIDLIHSHGYKASVFSFFCTYLKKMPIMATCHLWFKGVEGRPLKTKMMLALEKLCYRYFPVVVSVSEEIRQVLIDEGVARDKLPVVKNGIVVSDYTEQEMSVLQGLRSEFGLQPGDACILNVGRLTEQKAQQHIVSAAAQINNQNPRVKFLIVGDGGLREPLQKQIKELGLEGTVKLLGFRSDVAELLQLADLFILPSLDEGMPIALLEAIASKVPVISTPVGDIPKLIISNVSGIVVEINDVDGLSRAISDLLSNQKMQVKLTGNAWSSLMKNYSSRSMFAEYDQIYSDIFKG